MAKIICRNKIFDPFVLAIINNDDLVTVSIIGLT